MAKAPTDKVNKALCQVCREQQHKYKCPACHLPYCSVACFKLHKGVCGKPKDDSGPSTHRPEALSLNSTTLVHLEQTPTALDAPLLPRLVLPESYRRDSPLPDPLRSLTSLKWPAEPDPSIFLDPLRRDDPKPLRREELMRIATSPSLRHVIASQPSLRPSLLAISKLDPALREVALQKCLGLDSSTLSGNMARSAISDGFFLNEESIQMFAGESRRGGGRGRGRGGHRTPYLRGSRTKDSVFVGKEEQDALKSFAELVRLTLEDEGEDGRRKMEWDV